MLLVLTDFFKRRSVQLIGTLFVGIATGYSVRTYMERKYDQKGIDLPLNEEQLNRIKSGESLYFTTNDELLWAKIRKQNDKSL
jgi:hypothetical protein